MKQRGLYAMVLFALIFSAGSAFAAPATLSEAVVVDAFGAVVGNSSLVRTDNGLSLTLSTSGLIPGDVYTVWWIIFKPDGMGGLEFGVITNASGNQANSSGEMTVAAHINGGPLPPLDGITTIFSQGGPMVPREAIVRAIVRTHGPKIPGTQPDQFSTINGGCPPNSCFDIHITQHLP